MRRAVGVLAIVTSLLLCAPVVGGDPASAEVGPTPAYEPVEPTFDDIAGVTQYSGIDAGGAAWGAEVPDDWNGELVLFAHGFVSPDETALTVAVPPGGLREYWLEQGYAWAASSYRANGYGVVSDAVDDTRKLIDHVATETGQQPTRVYLHGASLGGHVAAVSIERYPDAYDGAMPVCGVLGDTELFQYFVDAGLTASALAGIPTEVPAAEGYLTETAPATARNLGLDASITSAGHQWSTILERQSGGERPLFDQAFRFWTATDAPTAVGGLPFLLAAYGGALTGGDVDDRITAVTGTDGIVYHYDDDMAVSPAEEELNAAVLRYPPDPAADPPLPVIEGEPSVPVLSLHGIGDLFAPFSMEQVYARRVADNSLSERFVSRAIRAVGHCDFTDEELQTAFDDLIAWVTDGVKPAGDAIDDPFVVHERYFGCKFTTEDRANAEPCPAEPVTQRIRGGDRISTAIALSQEGYATAQRVIVARSDLAADALAAAGYAGGSSPILLSPRDALPGAVAAEIERLGATEVALLGGPRALSDAVKSAAGDIPGVEAVVRVAGADRYATAGALAEEIRGGGTQVETVFLVKGSGSGTHVMWADAAAVSGLAAFLGAPVLLSEPSAVPAATRQAIASIAPDTITIAGGPAAIGQDVVTALETIAPVERLAGADRYATSAAIVERGLASGMALQRPFIATGRSVTDALVAGPAAAADGQSLVMVNGTDLTGSQSTLDLLFERGALVTTLRIAGGEQAVSTDVEGFLLTAVTPPDT